MAKDFDLYTSKLDYNPSVSSLEALDFINELHQDGHEGCAFGDPEWVCEVDVYHLVWMPIAEASIKWCKGQHGHLGYHLLDENMPPIVIGGNGFIVDGMHRYAAALESNQEFILAYVPMDFVDFGVKPQFA
ncbi:hypothetical protein LMH73_010215 [Vibrio splendidus]|nr:hypothetical protein [Vibrio splendidus]MCC4882957.1 hypothetical protein [Vibrio splendidus]